MFVIKVFYAMKMLRVMLPKKNQLIALLFLQIQILIKDQNLNIHPTKFQNGWYLNTLMEEEYLFPIIIGMIQGKTMIPKAKT